MLEFGSLLHRRSLPSSRYDRPAYVPPRRDPYYPLAPGASSDATPRLRRSTPYEPVRFHYTPYDRPAGASSKAAPPHHPAAAASSDVASPYYPVAAASSSKAAPPHHPYAAAAASGAASPYHHVASPPYYPVAAAAASSSSSSKAAPPHHPAAAAAAAAAPPYHQVASPPYHLVAAGTSSEAAPPSHPAAAGASSEVALPYHPVAAGAFSDAAPPYHPVASGTSFDAAPPYHPVASGTSFDATPCLSANAPRPSSYNDSEFPTIGPLFLPNNLDSVCPSSPPRCRPCDLTIIGPIPAGAAYYGVIDASKYDLKQSSAPRARRGKIICALCNTKGYHLPTSCPYMVIATQLEIFRSRPPNNLRYQEYFVEGRQGVHGCGIGNYAPPRRDVAARARDVAESLQKDGLNLVRITNLPEDMKPEALYKQFDKFGPVTNAIIFIDLSLGFVNFVRVEDAEKAMKELNSSGFGHLMWASQTPQ